MSNGKIIALASGLCLLGYVFGTSLATRNDEKEQKVGLGPVAIWKRA